MSRTPKNKAALPAALSHERDRFLEWSNVQGAAVATVKSRAWALNQLLGFCAEQGVADVRAVQGDTLRAYQNWLRKKSYTPWTQMTHLESIRRFFAFLEKTDVILVNPCGALITPQMGERLPRGVLSHKQVQRLLNAPDTQTKKGLRDRALLEMFYSTGLRCQEMARLGIHDVDTKNGFVRVLKGKGGRERVVPLGKKAAQYVAEYLRVVRSDWAKAQREERALWLGMYAPHGPMKTQAVAVTVKNYLRACGVRQGRAHLWRHTCATHLVASGANIVYVQQLLGHRSLETTQRYTRVAIPEVKRTHHAKHPRARTKTVALAAPVPAKGKIKGHYTAYDAAAATPRKKKGSTTL